MWNEEMHLCLDYDPGYGGSCSGREHWTKEQSDKELKRLGFRTVDQDSYSRGFSEGCKGNNKGYKRGYRNGIREGLRRKEEHFIDLYGVDKKTLEKISEAVRGTNLEGKVKKISGKKK